MMKRAGRKTTRRRVRDDRWRLPDALWAEMEKLLPPRPKHPLGCHNPRVPDRAAMDAVFFVLRTGCQWNALRETGICSSTSAHRRFQEWAEAGVFAAFWREGLLAYDGLVGIDWTWLALDGAMGKAPLGGGLSRSAGQPARTRPTAASAGSSARCSLTDVACRLVPWIDGANRNDHKLMCPTLDAIAAERPRPTRRRPQHLCLDKGYDYDEPRVLAGEFGCTLHLRSRGEEAWAKRHARAKARRPPVAVRPAASQSDR